MHQDPNEARNFHAVPPYFQGPYGFPAMDPFVGPIGGVPGPYYVHPQASEFRRPQWQFPGVGDIPTGPYNHHRPAREREHGSNQPQSIRRELFPESRSSSLNHPYSVTSRPYLTGPTQREEVGQEEKPFGNSSRSHRPPATTSTSQSESIVHTGLLSPEYREKLLFSHLKDTLKNRPYLKKFSSEAISIFYKSWVSYKDKLVQERLPVRLSSCIKHEVLTQLCSHYKCSETDMGILERKLKQRHLAFTESMKITVRDKIRNYIFPSDHDFGRNITKVIEDLEQFARQSDFHALEEKQLCKKFLRRMPRWLFKGGSDYVFEARELYAFSSLISYLRDMPQTTLDIDQLQGKTRSPIRNTYARGQNDSARQNNVRKERTYHRDISSSDKEQGSKDIRQRSTFFKRKTPNVHAAEVDSQTDNVATEPVHDAEDSESVTEDETPQVRAVYEDDLSGEYSSDEDYDSFDARCVVQVRRTQPSQGNSWTFLANVRSLDRYNPVRALMDSGCERSLIGKSQLGSDVLDTIRPSSIRQVRLPDKSLIPVLGELVEIQ